MERIIEEVERLKIDELLASGCVIRIEPFAPETKDYAWTEFWMDKGEIWSRTPGFGRMCRTDIRGWQVESHVENMIRNGFQVKIHAGAAK